MTTTTTTRYCFSCDISCYIVWYNVCSGIGIICCKSCNKSSHWCIPRSCIQWQPCHRTGVICCYTWRLFSTACCSWVVAWEMSSSIVGFTHCLGESRPICGEISAYFVFFLCFYCIFSWFLVRFELSVPVQVIAWKDSCPKWCKVCWMLRKTLLYSFTCYITEANCLL